MWNQRRRPVVQDEPKRVVLVGPAGRARQLVARELADLGYAVLCASSVEAALAFVRTGLMDAVVVQLSRFRAASLRRLARGLLAHPRVYLIGAVSIFWTVDPCSSTPGRLEDGSPGRRSPWQLATSWAGFASPKQLAQGLSAPLN